MKKLILVQAGETDPTTGWLTPSGEDQIRRLSERLVSIVGIQSVAVHCAFAMSTLHSATLVAAALGVGISSHTNLGTEVGQQADERVLAFVEQHEGEADTLILVVPFSTVFSFTRYFVENRLSRIHFRPTPLPHQAVLIDLEDTTGMPVRMI